jgi:RNA polymerase sigma-70 factor (ECF subfamily)
VIVSRDELTALVGIHQAELFRYLLYLGARDRATAEDLVQETFLAAFRSAQAPCPSDERSQAAWLRGIARNLFFAHCRKGKKLKPLDNATLQRAEEIWACEFLGAGDGFDYVEALQGCLKRLSERQRQLLDLRYADEKSRAEMAELLRLTEDGVKIALRRIRALLADCIQQRLHAERA